MELYLQFAGGCFSLAEEEDDKENIILPFSSFSSDFASSFPREREALQDITSAAIHNVRPYFSTEEMRPHLELGVRTSSAKRK